MSPLQRQLQFFHDCDDIVHILVDGSIVPIEDSFPLIDMAKSPIVQVADVQLLFSYQMGEA